nr:FimV/HubP family polar landmark protein [Lysobacter sp. GX 14042]
MLLLASQAAAALGLGQIRLKSGLGEPLLAEIPVVSSVPGELERLRVGLASPETFARIGLDPPRGVVADLQFNLALGDDGQPVIRVTSPQPIDEPMLSFLVEVDWGQGRLVREYSALVDAPRTVSAPLAPPVQAPVAAPSNTIVRAPASATQDEPDPVDGSPADAASDAPAEPPTESPAPAQAVATASVPVPPTPATAAQRPGEVRVQSGDTLSQLARSLELEGSLEQAMIALLRSNPGAFIDGNIHLLRAGAVLRVPGGSTVAEVDAAQALAQVREQTRAWRQANQAVAQPAAGAGTATQLAGDAPDTAGAEGGPEAAAADARLEIVPPGASDATAAGTRSGISEGGEGDTMRQELQQANEVLAAREAELDEMRSRLAELEKIQADQRELISLKDNELASVQAELAQAREHDAPASGTGWWIGGGALLLLVLLGGWLMRRKADQAPRFRAPVEPAEAPVASDPRASAFPASAPAAAATAPAWHAGGAEDERPAAAPQATETTAPAVASPRVDPAAEEHRADLPPDGPGDAPAGPAVTTDTGSVDDPADFQAEAPGHERLELARAYLDLGDGDSARQLLTELVVSGDLASRQEAARLLRELD